jgi:acyl carrier protein
MSGTVEHVSDKVVNILAVISKKHPEELADDAALIEDLGIDSIQFLEFFSMLEERFDIQLEVEDLRPELFRTVRSVVHFVQGKIKA